MEVKEMPDFKNATELAKITEIHTSSLSPEEKSWFENECKKVHEKTGYQINRRTSGDNAFRMYLMSDKGFALNDVIDLRKMPKETLMSHMKDFFNTINNPNKTPEENIKEIGRIHKNAYAKIADYQVPNLGELKSVNDLGDVQPVFYVLTSMFIDDTQDTKLMADNKTAEPAKKAAFYNGAGGEANIQPAREHWAVMSNFFGDMFTKFSKGNVYNPMGSAMAFDLTKMFFKENAGKKVMDLPTWRGPDYMRNSSTVMTESMNYNEVDNKKEFDQCKAYLNGKSKTFPGQAEFEKTVENNIRSSRAELNNKTAQEAENLTNHAFNAYVSEFKPHTLQLDQLNGIDYKTQNKFTSIYDKTFGKFYTGAMMLPIQAIGKDQFDFIMTPENKSIRQLCEEKYPGLEPQEAEKVMKIETVRNVLTNPKGLQIQYAGYTGKGNIIRVGADAKNDKYKFFTKNVPDSLKINVNSKISTEDVNAFNKDPKASNRCTTLGATLKYTIQDFGKNHAALLEKHNLTAWDCFYIGNKSLNDLYKEKYPEDKTINQDVAAGFLATEVAGAKPIFATTLTENSKGNLVRTTIPITFKGEVSPAHDRVQNLEETLAFGAFQINQIELKEKEIRQEKERIEKEKQAELDKLIDDILEEDAAREAEEARIREEGTIHNDAKGQDVYNAATVINNKKKKPTKPEIDDVIYHDKVKKGEVDENVYSSVNVRKAKKKPAKTNFEDEAEVKNEKEKIEEVKNEAVNDVINENIPNNEENVIEQNNNEIEQKANGPVQNDNEEVQNDNEKVQNVNEEVQNVNEQELNANDLEQKAKELNQNSDNIIDTSNNNNLNHSVLSDDSVVKMENPVEPAPQKAVKKAKMPSLKDYEQYLSSLKYSAGNARGILSDSTQYKLFYSAIDDVAEAVRNTKKKIKNGKLNINDDNAYDEIKDAIETLKECAVNYEEYKMADHSANPKLDKTKKKLNGDDKRKLKIMDDVLSDTNRFFNKVKVNSPVSDNRFLLKTDQALARLKDNKNLDMYKNHPSLYVRDSAYAVMGQMHRYSKYSLPVNTITGKKISLQDFMDAKIASGEFKQSLIKDNNKFYNPVDIAKMAESPKKIKEIIDKFRKENYENNKDNEIQRKSTIKSNSSEMSKPQSGMSK